MKKFEKSFKVIQYIFIFCLLIFSIQTDSNAMDLAVEIPCSFNPVVSGARSFGLSGAFIGLSNDATASATNPGGLIQLLYPEGSIVYNQLIRYEDYQLGKYNTSNDSSVTEKNLNFLSLSFPFEWINRNWVFSVAYQHLYNFDRELLLNARHGTFIVHDEHVRYHQKGQLSALGFSFCAQITPHFSLGCTLNFWEDFLTDNGWQQTYNTRDDTIYNDGFNDSYTSIILNTKHRYDFNGFNMNVGFLWDFSEYLNYEPGKIKMGMVLKTPFTADLTHIIQTHSDNPFKNNLPTSTRITTFEEMEMPLSLGIGLVYNFSLSWLATVDLYYTNWQNFLIRNTKYPRREINPISSKNHAESDISDTIHVRIGTEYILRRTRPYAVPLRCGLFYDPAPAEKNPDDFFGFSIGTGITKDGHYSLDIAYQYRMGNDVGQSYLSHLDFKEKIEEHSFMISTIFYSK